MRVLKSFDLRSSTILKGKTVITYDWGEQMIAIGGDGLQTFYDNEEACQIITGVDLL